MPPLKDILGKPGEGIHFHVLGIALVDVILTMIAAGGMGYLFARLFNHTLGEAILAWSIIWFFAIFALGQALHLLIGVETTVAKFLKDPWGER